VVATPVSLLTGFLGAGKTTVLRHLLSTAPGRVGLIVNDFGDVPLDGLLLRESGHDVLALEGGCVCCSLRSGLVAAVSTLLQRTEPPTHLVIEASGVSEPVALALGLLSPALRAHVRLDAVLSVANLAQIEAQRDGDYGPLVEAQLAAASVVVHTHADLLPDAAPAREEVRALAPHALHLDARDPLLPPLVWSARSEVVLPEASGASHPAFTAWSAEVGGVLTYAALKAFLQRLPQQVVRVKGLVALDTYPGARVAVHKVGPHLTFSRDAAPAPTTNRIVCIGREGGITSEALQEALVGMQVGA
jgi:G3E family GTPase